MDIIFSEITIIICLVAILSVVFQRFNQPAILAYILTGVIVGPLGIIDIQNQNFLETLSSFGITLLLFMLGLEIKIREFPSIGKIALIVGAGQIIATLLFGFILAVSFGFSYVSSLYIGVALAFSSTIIVVKLLSDKRDLHSLSARVVVGILVIQDFLAILVLIFLSSFNIEGSIAETFVGFSLALVKAIILFSFVIYLSLKFFPKIVEFLSKSQEVLFLVSIAWAFGLATVVSSPIIGFSVEIGGFLAGLALANSIANYQIIGKARVLRDFFIILFFVAIGTKMTFGNDYSILFPAIALSLFVFILKPLVVIISMGFLGFRKRTSFLSGISLAQISEFSLIIVFLGNKLGHIPQNVVTLITLVGLITFTISSYMIANSNSLYQNLSSYFKIFEKKHTKEEKMISSDEGLENLDGHTVLIGGDQMGESILEALQDLGKRIVVIDFDPAIVKKLVDKKSLSIYGDISDLDIQDRAKLNTARLIISTVPDIEDNLLLLKKHKVENRKALIVVMALDSTDAKILYKEGADYVILPHLAGGRQIAEILKEDRLEEITKLKSKDMKYLT